MRQILKTPFSVILDRCVPYEGLQTIVEVAEIIKNNGLKGVKFVIVGDGSAKNDLIELVYPNLVETWWI